jgi:hypothetical protein
MSNGLPIQLEFEKSLMYFHAYMYGPLRGKVRLFAARNISLSSCYPRSGDWEIFASLLMNDLGRKVAAGVDLENHEVKSVKFGNDFEYQYHKLRGRAKLIEDMQADHLFFEYSDLLQCVELRFAPARSMKERFFEEWLATYPVPYERQRHRKCVPNSWVAEHCELLMRIENGEVSHPASSQL